MLRRMTMRDYARYNRGGRGRDSAEMDYNRGGNRGDYRGMPQMYPNDYAMGDRAYDSNSRNRYTPRGFDSRSGADYERSNPAFAEPDYARGGDRAMRDREFDGHYGYPVYPFEIAGRVGREYPMFDHRMSGGTQYLTEHELKDWAKRLLSEVDEKDKLIPKEKDYSLKLFMVGDALIHSGVYMDAEKPDGTYDFAGHEMFVNDDGELEYEEIPVGCIPESGDAKLVYDAEKEKTSEANGE